MNLNHRSITGQTRKQAQKCRQFLIGLREVMDKLTVTWENNNSSPNIRGGHIVKSRKDMYAINKQQS